MTEQLWVNPRQPQTLYLAQVLMYIRGVLAILFGALFAIGRLSIFGSELLGGAWVLLITVGLIAGAYGIANEQRWGYQLGLAAALGALLFPALRLFRADISGALSDPIGLMFDIALVALLLHPMSKEYQKIWFR